MMKTLYRVEHPVTKTGPWNSEIVDGFLNCTDAQKEALRDLKVYINSDQMYEHFRRHIPVHMDFAVWNDRMICAVDSKKQLREWFNDETLLIHLMVAGFTVVKITIDSNKVFRGFTGMQFGIDQYEDFTKKDIGLNVLLDNA